MVTIAWDVDDVLNDFTQVWYAQKWLPEHPGCNVPFDALIRNPPHQVLGVGKDEYLASLDEFRLSGDFHKVKPSGEILQWLGRHGAKAHHVALTAAPSVAVHVSAQWVMKHFWTWIKTFHCIPSYREAANDVLYDQSKVEYIKRTKTIDVLVEDNPENLVGLTEIEKKGLLVARPWNKGKRIEDVLEELTTVIASEARQSSHKEIASSLRASQ